MRHQWEFTMGFATVLALVVAGGGCGACLQQRESETLCRHAIQRNFAKTAAEAQALIEIERVEER
jgi:hypothetical protein